ncbi:hypothetical protein BC939DRAFT_529436 [Gamsiella multidivaricata]|uniref:uncharacterized protein n=1 Tax=Gamsiella multidivaricata TaxID=101098 RepID=UPI00221F02E8|nr:uncharacterized protein BC939DRAFT_529436 [Gamsiella multidivaricata]KAG0353936.1 hypothetical protein BGZ54_001957 [Gamsiella multidivaricata]KAI7822737.1 hypothetical protein BC939DRAFT_529436 [Gamsiella multidivaricata]
MSSTDYRVSQIVVLCKDCGNDVGLYPGRHKCPPAPAMPTMPSIPLKYQQQAPSSFSASSAPSRSNGRRPPDLNPDSLYGSGAGSSYGSSGNNSRTPTSASFQERSNGSRTPTASSFQERMRERDREKQQREREEREAAARAVREDTRLDAPTTSTSTPAAGAGTTIWSRLRAAKEVINATITGEEKWPESDDSDHEGETHVRRTLREFADKKEEKELAAKVAELEMTPIDSPGSLSKNTGASRNQYLRDAVNKEHSPSIISSTSSNEREDYYGRSLRARGETGGGGGGQDPSERSWSPTSSSISTATSNNSYGSGSLNLPSNSAREGGGNRYRTTSDASRDDALSRLEGKSQGDKLATQVSHLGSTSPRGRANSPNVGHRPQDGPPAPSPSSSSSSSSSSAYQQKQQYGNSDSSRYQQQQQYNNQLSPSSAGGGIGYNNNYSSSPSQRSVSPGANRRYDSPSSAPGPGPSSSSSASSRQRYAGQPPVSPSYNNHPNSGGNNYHQQPPPSSSSRGDAYGGRSRGPDPGQGYGGGGRPDYERRPTYPPQGGPPGNSGGGNSQGAYGQRQQQHQQHPHQQYPSQHHAYGTQGNYF